MFGSGTSRRRPPIASLQSASFISLQRPVRHRSNGHPHSRLHSGLSRSDPRPHRSRATSSDPPSHSNVNGGLPRRSNFQASKADIFHLDIAERKIRDGRTGHARRFFGRPPIKYDPGPQRERNGVPKAPSRRGRGRHCRYFDADDARLVRTPRGLNDRTCLRRHVNRLRSMHGLDRLDHAVSVHDRSLRGRGLTQQSATRPLGRAAATTRP